MAKKTKLTNLIILDASGSMASKTEEVRGGLKLLFKQISDDANKDKKKVTTRTIVVDFSSPGDFNVVVDSKDSLTFDEKVASNYKTRGMTALYDAIGKGFEMVGSDQDSVFVNILTDGEENSSRSYDKVRITSLIKEKEDVLWGITFMGTTKAAIQNAQSMGMAAGNTFSFMDSASGVKDGMKKMSRSRGAYYASAGGAGGQSINNMDLEEKSLLKKKLSNLMEDDKK